MNEFKKLSDAEWVNIVNHPLVIGYGGGRTAEDAVAAAFKLIEEKLYEKNQPILEELHSRIEALEQDNESLRTINEEVKALAEIEKDAEFLNWIADRIVYVYGESNNVDFVIKLRSIATMKSQKEENND